MADAADAARLINDLYADVCRDHPERFYAFAALPLPHVDESLEEIARTLDTRWMVGVTIGCSVGDRQLDDPVFEPVFQELDRRQTLVFLHPVGLEPAALEGVRGGTAANLLHLDQGTPSPG